MQTTLLGSLGVLTLSVALTFQALPEDPAEDQVAVEELTGTAFEAAIASLAAPVPAPVPASRDDDDDGGGGEDDDDGGSGGEDDDDGGSGGEDDDDGGQGGGEDDDDGGSGNDDDDDGGGGSRSDDDDDGGSGGEDDDDGGCASKGDDDDDGGCATPFCFGRNCPCNNDDKDAGCANSTGSGALLEAFGTTSTSADDLTFQVTGGPLPPFMSTVILEYAPEQQKLPFGGGFDCLRTPNTTRDNQFRPMDPIVPRKLDEHGAAQFGPGLIGISCDSPALDCIEPGSCWNFQVYYRDSSLPNCPGRMMNSTNALKITFVQ